MNISVSLLRIIAYIVIALCGVFIISWTEWCFHADGEIEFEQFKCMYDINPYPWWCKTFGPVYRVDHIDTSFRMSLIDTIRYLGWQLKNDREVEATTRDAKLFAVYKEWEKDISQYLDKT